MIEQIGFIPKTPVGPAAGKPADGAAQISESFGAFLDNAMNNINNQQKTVDALNEKFAAGEIADVHQLTIAAEKLALSLELTVHIRNKAVEAYQEIMRTQI